MTIVILLLLYLALPFAELAAIIVLAVLNGQKKRRIDELNRELAAIRAEAVWRPENAPVSSEAERGFAVPRDSGDWLNSPSAPDWVETERAAQAPIQPDTPPAPAPIRPDIPPAIRQGTVALVVGVVFVILAGLIFATTAWRILPDLFKVVLVMAFSGIFFGASAIADHRLHIRATSKAFYILGSIFLFVAVLAVGFFRLFGRSFRSPAVTGTCCFWLARCLRSWRCLRGLENLRKPSTRAAVCPVSPWRPRF